MDASIDSIKAWKPCIVRASGVLLSWTSDGLALFPNVLRA